MELATAALAGSASSAAAATAATAASAGASLAAAAGTGAATAAGAGIASSAAAVGSGLAAGAGLTVGGIASYALQGLGAIQGLMGGNQSAALARSDAAWQAYSMDLRARDLQRQGQQAETEAEIADFNARQALIQGTEESNALRDKLIKTLAAQNAAFAASGVSLDSGSPVDVGQQTVSDAERELRISRSNTIVAAGGRTLDANAKRLAAAGYYDAADTQRQVAGATAAGGAARADALRTTAADRSVISLLDFGSRKLGWQG